MFFEAGHQGTEGTIASISYHALRPRGYSWRNDAHTNKMDREQIRQTDEKLAIDKEKVTKEVDDREVGVVILPAVKVDSDD